MRLFLFSFLFSGVAAAQSLTLGAVGDSISVGTDAEYFGENPELSWATGDGINSHKKRLERMYTEVRSVNAAFNGARVSDLEAQVDQVLVEDPAYVTVMIGGNDVCQWTEFDGDVLQHFAAQFKSALMRLTEDSSRNVLVVPIPDLLHLRATGLATYPQCQFIWNITGICDPLLSSNTTEEQRRFFKNRVDAVNSVMKAAADQYGVKYASAVATERFLPAHISAIDCFHPSRLGQEYLSLKTWSPEFFIR